MGGGGKGGSVQPQQNPYTQQQAELSQKLWDETDPTRQALTSKYNTFLSGNYDVRQDPSFQAIYNPSYTAGRQGLEQQYTQAKQNALSNFAPGGALARQMMGLETARASDVGSLPGQLTSQLSGNIINNLNTQAYGMASGMPAVSIGGYGSSGNTYQSALNQEMQSQSQGKGGLGSGIGSMLGQGIGGYTRSDAGSKWLSNIGKAATTAAVV